MFFRKEFPYLFTILIALIGWTINHISNRILDSKLIYYSSRIYLDDYNDYISEFKDSTFKVMELSIKNLTTDKLYKDLFFTIKLPDSSENGEIKALIMKPTPPLLYKGYYEEKVFGRMTSVKIEGLHPQTSVKLLVYFKGEYEPKIFLEYNKISKRNIDDPILFLKSGIRTKILENETTIFITLLIIWIILIGFYLFKLRTVNHEI